MTDNWNEVKTIHDKALANMLKAEPHQRPMARTYLTLACLRLRELGQHDLSSLSGFEERKEGMDEVTLSSRA